MSLTAPLVRACVDPTAELLLSDFVLTEVISATNGLVRQGIEPPSVANALLHAFESDLSSYTIIPFDATMLQIANRLLRQNAPIVGLRPMDAIHIATALVEHRRTSLDSFITTDRVMVAVATAEGLTVLP